MLLTYTKIKTKVYLANLTHHILTPQIKAIIKYVLNTQYLSTARETLIYQRRDYISYLVHNGFTRSMTNLKPEFFVSY